MNASKIASGVVVVGLLVLAAYWLGTNSDGGRGTTVIEPVAPVATAPVPGSSTSVAAASVKPKPHRTPQVELNDDGTAPVPFRYQFAAIKQVQTGVNFEDWMAQYSAADQVIIRAFNEQHFGMYENRGPEQIAWMAANGYPMPEDILAAQAMRTERLKQMAKSGSDKAAFLLKDRYLTQLAQLMNGQNLTYGEAAKQLNYMRIDMIELPGGIYRSTSPYKAYLTARTAAVKGSNTDEAFEDAMVLAALTWARNLGDLRADDLIMHYVQADPDQRTIRGLLRVAMIATTDMTLNQRQTIGFNCDATPIPYPRPDSTW